MGDVEPNDLSSRQLYSFQPSRPGALPDSAFDSLAVETGPTVHGEVFRGGEREEQVPNLVLAEKSEFEGVATPRSFDPNSLRRRSLFGGYLLHRIRNLAKLGPRLERAGSKRFPGLGFAGTADRDHTRSKDSGFLPRDFSERVAQRLDVIEPDLGHQREHRRAAIGRIQAPSHTDLEHGQLDLRSGEPETGRRGESFEIGWRLEIAAAGPADDFLQQFGQLRSAHGRTVYA